MATWVVWTYYNILNHIDIAIDDHKKIQLLECLNTPQMEIRTTWAMLKKKGSSSHEISRSKVSKWKRVINCGVSSCPKFAGISANHCGLRTPRSCNIDAPHVKISWRVSKLPRLMSKVEKAKMVVAVWILLHPFALRCFGIHPTTSSTTYRALINAAWYWGIIPSRHSFCCVFILGRWMDHLNLGVINFHVCHHLWSQHLRPSWKIQGTHTKHPIPAGPRPSSSRKSPAHKSRKPTCGEKWRPTIMTYAGWHVFYIA